MTDKDFEKLSRYLDSRFETQDLKITEAIRASEDRMNIRFDDVIGAIDDIRTDQAAKQSQLNRHEDWIVKADKNLKLGYES